MRVAQIAPPWFTVPPRSYGGTEVIVSLLADGLVDRGYEVTLFAPVGSRTKARLISPLVAEAPDKIGDAWYEASHVLAAYRQAHEFDIIHDHTWAVGAAVGAASGETVVQTLHRDFNETTTMLYRQVDRRIWLVAISNSQRSHAPPGLRWAGVVHEGIAVNQHPYRGDKEDYLLFLGRVAPEKAPDLAIQAARRAGRKLVMCIKVRSQEEQRYWSERVEPLLGSDVDIRGECSHQEKLELLAGAAALLFPIQWSEPFGLVMIEAMACGTPVIAWRNGSVPEVVADGTTGFIADTIDGFVDAINRLGELDPKTIRSYTETHYSADAMVTGYERAYQTILSGGDR